MSRDARTISQKTAERACRVYQSNKDAANGLGTSPSFFAAIYRRYGLESPNIRRQRTLREARGQRTNPN